MKEKHERSVRRTSGYTSQVNIAALDGPLLEARASGTKVFEHERRYLGSRVRVKAPQMRLRPALLTQRRDASKGTPELQVTG